jgi:predicted transposase YbfD/YdcC
VRRHYGCIVLKIGEISSELTYGITSLPFPTVNAAALEQLWRAHWTIENRVHRVRNGTAGEDAGRIHTGPAAHALAALRSAILNLFGQISWAKIADPFRH